jgi:hypothetical protein
MKSLMATVRINSRKVYDCRNIPGIECIFMPGINIAVPDTAYDVVKAHPTLKWDLEASDIEFINREPEVKGEDSDGMLLADNQVTGEAAPVILPTDRKKVGKGDSK